MAKTQGKVHSIISNLVLVKVEGPVSQNEICFIEENGERLMAEVIKVVGDLAYVLRWAIMSSVSASVLSCSRRIL